VITNILYFILAVFGILVLIIFLIPKRVRERWDEEEKERQTKSPSRQDTLITYINSNYDLNVDPEMTLFEKGVGRKSIMFDGLAIDEENKKVCFFEKQRYSDTADIRIFDWASIIQVESRHDNETIYKQNVVGGAAVGGLVFGPVGAIVGALSAAKKQAEKIRDLSLHITVNDVKKPLYSIRLYPIDFNKEVLNVWCSRFKIIIDQNSDNKSKQFL